MLIVAFLAWLLPYTIRILNLLKSTTMKKLFIIGLGLTISSMAFQAKAQQSQSAANDQMRFGIKAGVNLMNLGKYSIGGSDYSTDSKVGFQAGIYADLPMGGGFAFMPEITYTQKGAKLKETILSNKAELNAKINYLDVPILIGYKATPEFSIFVGPQASFLLSQSTEFRNNGVKVGDEYDSTKNFKKSIVGGVVGVGYSFTPNVSVNARYTMDFQKAFDDNLNQDKLKNKGFALSLGYTF